MYQKQHQDTREVSGVNTRAELAEFENLIRRATVRSLMIEGVTFIDPGHAYVSSEARLGRDCVIHPNVHIEGKSVIGEGCEIRQGSRITDSQLGNRVTVKDHCVIVDSEIADDCAVGPFAHLRMNSRMEERSVVGNFVEVKKSRIGRGTKSMHLTYLGDATIGEDTNIDSPDRCDLGRLHDDFPAPFGRTESACAVARADRRERIGDSRLGEQILRQPTGHRAIAQLAKAVDLQRRRARQREQRKAQHDQANEDFEQGESARAPVRRQPVSGHGFPRCW